MSTISDVTDETFEAEVLQADGVVLIDVWAPFARQCRGVDTIVAELADELGDAVKVVRVNAEEAPGVADDLEITSIPTLLIVRDGEIVAEMIGPRPKADIRAALAAHVAA